MKEPRLKFLMIEDNLGDSRLFHEMLKEIENFEFELHISETLNDGLKILNSSYDLVFLDLSLPDSTGLQTVKTFFNHTKKIPVVVLTGTNDNQLASQIVALGAQDYLDKGKFDIYAIKRVIKYSLERHRLLQKIISQSNLTRMFMDNLPCIALLLKPNTREVIISNKMAKEHGIEIGKPCYETWFGFEKPCEWCLAPLALETKDVQTAEINLLEFNGTVWEASWIPIQEDLYMHYAFDITEKKQAQEKLKEMNEKLEQLVEKRTKNLKKAKDKLVRHEKLALLGKLAGSVGHELRNPLSVLNNSIYYLNMKCNHADEKFNKHLNIMQDEINRAKRIINDLLGLSRIKAIQLEPIDIRNIIKISLTKLKIPDRIEVFF